MENDFRMFLWILFQFDLNSNPGPINLLSDFGRTMDPLTARYELVRENFDFEFNLELLLQS